MKQRLPLYYDVVEQDGEKRVKLLDEPPQVLDNKELVEWMAQTRDDEPDLYSELVQAYFKTRK